MCHCSSFWKRVCFREEDIEIYVCLCVCVWFNEKYAKNVLIKNYRNYRLYFSSFRFHSSLLLRLFSMCFVFYSRAHEFIKRRKNSPFVPKVSSHFYLCFPEVFAIFSVQFIFHQLVCHF